MISPELAARARRMRPLADALRAARERARTDGSPENRAAVERARNAWRAARREEDELDAVRAATRAPAPFPAASSYGRPVERRQEVGVMLLTEDGPMIRFDAAYLASPEVVAVRERVAAERGCDEAHDDDSPHTEDEAGNRVCDICGAAF